MARHKSTTSALSEVAENIDNIAEENNDIFVYTSKQRIQYLNQYVVVFIQNLRKIVMDFKLTRNEVSVLLSILEKMQMGNLVSLSFASISRELNIDQANVSRVKKKFIQSKLMLEVDGNLFINPHIIAYGGFSEVEKNKDNIKLLNKSYEEIQNTNLTPSIATKKIREQENNKKRKKKVEQEINEIINDSNKLLKTIEENNPLKENVEA